ncbi:MAG TPA: flagellar biosynthetic protein FliO [Deltaproteobacteria bacterium]|nr:flagellar biosynthetic protein FliO [Deltaproteobacteria bacterium]HQB37962.1 flagellar biosynthetic protein FliO [Deltaproteobacteria bacterium]
MKTAVIVLLLMLPTAGFTEEPASQNFNFMTSFLQMVAALAIVVGLILLTRHFAARFAGGKISGLSSRHIRLIETRYLAPRKSLILIEVGGEYLLLASSDDRLTLLKQVDFMEEIDVVEEEGAIRSGIMGLIRRGSGKQGS